MKKYLMAIIVVFGAMSCADEQSAEEAFDPDWGFSKLLVLNPDSGEKRWHADSRGETIDVVRLQDNGNSVVVVTDDRCFPAPNTIAVSVIDGKEVTLIPSAGETVGISCDGVSPPGISALQFVDGYCVGIEDATGDLVAVDSLDATEAWRAAVGANSLSVFGSVVVAVAEVPVGTGTQYRLMRIASANGMILWQKQKTTPVVPLGADTTKIFLLDTAPYAVTVGVGDEVWRYEEKDAWPFDPSKDSGVLLGDTLFVERNGLKASYCGADTAGLGI